MAKHKRRGGSFTLEQLEEEARRQDQAAAEARPRARGPFGRVAAPPVSEEPAPAAEKE